jgi:cytochrome d ubiquinol oxidase subunit I
MAVYLIIFPAGILVMARMVRKGPAGPEADSPIESGRPASPTRIQLHSEEEAS